MSSRRGAHLTELAHVFAGTPVASGWAKKAAATRRARATQQDLPLGRAALVATNDQHLDVCQRCSDPRLDLCTMGAQLMAGARAAFAERTKPLARNQTTKGGPHVD